MEGPPYSCEVVYESDFSSGTDGFTKTFTDGILTGNATVGGEEDCLKFVFQDDPDGELTKAPGLNTTTDDNKDYAISFKLYIGASALLNFVQTQHIHWFIGAVGENNHNLPSGLAINVWHSFTFTGNLGDITENAMGLHVAFQAGLTKTNFIALKVVRVNVCRD